MRGGGARGGGRQGRNAGAGETVGPADVGPTGRRRIGIHPLEWAYTVEAGAYASFAWLPRAVRAELGANRSSTAPPHRPAAGDHADIGLKRKPTLRTDSVASRGRGRWADCREWAGRGRASLNPPRPVYRTARCRQPADGHLPRHTRHLPRYGTSGAARVFPPHYAAAKRRTVAWFPQEGPGHRAGRSR